MRGSAGVVLLLLALAGAGAVGWLVLGQRDSEEYLDAEAERAPDAQAQGGPMLAGHAREKPSAADAAEGEFLLRGSVTDAKGEPAADVRVTARRQGEERGPATHYGGWSGAQELRRAFAAMQGREQDGPPDAVATSAADGSFSLTLRRRGSYEVRAEPAPPSTGTWAAATARSGASPTIELRVLPGSALRGRVLDSQDRGVAAMIHAAWHGGALGGWKSGPLATDAASGAFTLPAVPEGDVQLELVLPGRARYTARSVKTPTGEEIVIRVGAEVPLLTGRVVTRAAQPVTGALVSASVQSALPLAPGAPGAEAVYVRYYAETGADGGFTILGALGGALTQVEALAAGYLHHSSHVQLAAWSGAVLGTPPAGPIEIVLFQGGTVEGRVTEKGTGQPLTGVQVQASPMAIDARVSASPPTAVVTDAQGRYRLEDVPLGRSGLSAKHETHYLAAQAKGGQGGNQMMFMDGMNFTMPGMPGASGVTVFIETEGQRVTRDLELEPGLELRGRVVGPDGAPVAGASVSSAQTEMVWGMDGEALQSGGTIAVSDAEGRFHARGLAPNKALVLTARKSGLIGVRSEPFVLAADTPAKDVVLRMEKGGVLVGQVVDDVGSPVEGVSVNAWPENGDGAYSGGQVTTRADGAFRLAGTGAGTWFVNAWHSDGRNGHLRVADLTFGEVREGLSIRMAKGVVLSGVLVDEQGRPAAGKNLTAQSGRGGMSQAYTQGDGKFTFMGIQAGAQQIYAGDWGGARVLLGTVDAPGTDVRVVWKEPPYSVIEGTVLDAQGKPVPLCSVRIRAGAAAPAPAPFVGMGPSSVPMPAGGPDWSGHQTVNGWFRQRVGGEPPYQVAVSAPQDTEGRALNLRPASVTVTDPKAGPVIVRLEPGLEIAGRVLDASGRGVADVAVTVFGLRTATDAEGAFAVGGLTEGTHKVLVQPTPPHVRPPETSAAAGTRDLLVRLTTGLPIAGTLRRADGRALGNGWIHANWPAAPGVAQGQVGASPDAQGRFRLEGVPPEVLVTVMTQVWSEGGTQFAPRTLRDVRPGTENLDIVVDAGASVSGTVADARGRPVRSGMVQISRPGVDPKQASIQHVQIKEDGSFQLAGLEPGPVEISFVASDGGAAGDPLKTDAPATGLRLVLPERTPIRGRLVGTLGDVSRWGVWAWPAEEPTRRVRAQALNSEGEFSLEGISGKGPWMIAARAEDDDRYGLIGPVEGGTEGLRLELRPGRTIEGTVQSLSGAALPTPGARVSITAPAWETRVVSDAQGVFKVRGVPPGRYALRARGADRAWGDEVKDVADGATHVRLTVK